DCVSGVARVPTWRVPGYIEATNRCLKYHTTPFTAHMLAMFPHWENGQLYVSGGLSDQPSVFLEAMTFIKGYLNASREA
ncbi:MAG: hypothetical protein AAGJ55_05280, partial [Cyanobacteria bacterium J06555_12]